MSRKMNSDDGQVYSIKTRYLYICRHPIHDFCLDIVRRPAEDRLLEAFLLQQFPQPIRER